MNLIVNADDFGLSPSVNQGIVDAHQQGIVTSTTVMVNLPDARQIVEVAKTHPNLGIGIHLNVTFGQPITSADRVPSLVDDQGHFLRPEKLEQAEVAAVTMEWEAQVGEFLSWGLKPTHLDSHHHVHSFPQFREVIAEIAKDLGVPVRFRNEETKQVLRYQGVLCPDHFVESFYGDGGTLEHLQTILANLKTGTTEIMCHPAYLDAGLAQITSYYEGRNVELQSLMAPEVKKQIEDSQIRLINFRRFWEF